MYKLKRVHKSRQQQTLNYSQPLTQAYFLTQKAISKVQKHNLNINKPPLL